MLVDRKDLASYMATMSTTFLTALSVVRQCSVVLSERAIPFACVAYDIRCQQEIILDTGSVVRNMRASMAIPGAFKAIRMDTLMLVDGGMSNNLPVDVVRKMGADVVIAVDLSNVSMMTIIRLSPF